MTLRVLEKRYGGDGDVEENVCHALVQDRCECTDHVKANVEDRRELLSSLMSR
jgi:hypothetical protein